MYSKISNSNFMIVTLQKLPWKLYLVDDSKEQFFGDRQSNPFLSKTLGIDLQSVWLACPERKLIRCF